MIVITGGMGFLGVHLARALLDAGEDVILTRRRTVCEPEFLQAEWGTRVRAVQVDLRDSSAVAEVLRTPGVSGLIHLAVPPRFGITPANELRVASEMLLAVVGTAVELGLPRVVMASSRAVYLGNAAPVWREDDAVHLETENSIAAIKRSEEVIASFLGHRSSTEVIRARITAVWGPYYRTMLNAPARIALLAAGRADRLRGLPDPRDAHPDDRLELMHVRDCARAIVVLQSAPHLDHNVYNVGGTLVRYGDLIDAANGCESAEPVQLRCPAREPTSDAVLDVSRIRALGYAPSVSVEAGMIEYVRWLQVHEA